MQRRDFITLLGGAVAWPLTALENKVVAMISLGQARIDGRGCICVFKANIHAARRRLCAERRAGR